MISPSTIIILAQGALNLLMLSAVWHSLKLTHKACKNSQLSDLRFWGLIRDIRDLQERLYKNTSEYSTKDQIDLIFLIKAEIAEMVEKAFDNAQ
jgi:hypothetical protein